MGTIETISSAIQLIDEKKQNLKNAFEALQTHSFSLSSFSLTWAHLDSHFSSLHSSLLHQFHLLQQQQQPQPSKITKNPSRPELKSFFDNTDGPGLRQYIFNRPRERPSIREQLPDLFVGSPDPGTTVLNAMEGFYSENDTKLSSLRRTCMVLLEELARAKLEFEGGVKDRAVKLAVEWKGKMMKEEEEVEPLETLALLNLLAAFGLRGVFNVDEIVDYVVVIVNYRAAMNLCRTLIPLDKIPEVIRKLIIKGKQLPAVKFIFEFGLADKFPLVPLLKEYVDESRKLAQQVRNRGNSSVPALNKATRKEIQVLNSVIKFLADHNLESEYPKKILVMRIEGLKNEIAHRKQVAAASTPNLQQEPKQKKNKGSKSSWSAANNFTVPLPQQPYPQPPGLLPDHPVPYLSSPVAPYGSTGPPAMALHKGPSLGPYGLSNLPPVPRMPSGYYGQPIDYGGYGLPPQHHPSS